MNLLFRPHKLLQFQYTRLRREAEEKDPMPMSLLLLNRMCSEFSFQMWNSKGKKKNQKTKIASAKIYYLFGYGESIWYDEL